MIDVVYETMSRLSHDILDIVKVNSVSWPVLGWTNDWSLSWIFQLDLASTERIFSIVLITITIIFTIFKLFVAYKDYRQEYGDKNTD